MNISSVSQLLLLAGLLGGQAGGTEWGNLSVAEEDILLENKDSDYGNTGFRHHISSLSTGTPGGALDVLYDGTIATRRSDIHIDSLSGGGSLVLRGMSTCSQNIFHLAAESNTGFTGNLELWNYSTAYDAERRYNSSAILELNGGTLSGSISLSTAIICGESPHHIVALGISGDTTLGGLDAAERSQTGAWLYSGQLKSGSASLAHEADFSTHITPATHTLTINTGGVHTFRGSMAGTFNIIKQGTGSQSFIGNLSKGNNYHAQGGTLHLQSTHTEAGSITIGSGAILTHTGQLSTGTLTMQGGELKVNGAFSAGSASFNGGSTLTATSTTGSEWLFQLGASDAPFLTLSGTAAIDALNISYTAADMTRGWYQLVQGSPLYAGSVTANGHAAQTEWRSDGLYLYIADGALTGSRTESAELIWQGTSGTWQTGDGHTGQNWSGPDTNSNFLTGDSVVFNHAAQITLVGELAPAGVEVNNASGTVVFEGNGKLTGTTGITKSGAGELRISTANVHSGTTILNGGTLTAAHTSALGSSTVLLRGGKLDMAGNTLNNNLLVQGHSSLSNASAFTGNIELQGGSLRTATLGNASLECTGPATLIADGTLVLNRSIMNSGQLSLQGTFDTTALAHSIFPTLVDAGGTTGSSGFVRDAGSEVQITTGGQLNTDAAQILLHGQEVWPDTTGYASLPGTTHLDTYLITDGHSVSTAAIEARAGSRLRRIDQQGGTLLVNTETTTLQAQSGRVHLQGARLHGGLSGTAALETAGQSELGGANTHSGGTTITSGSLRLLHPKAPGNGNIIVCSGALLDMNDLPVLSHLQLQGNCQLRRLENFGGSITLASGASPTIETDSVLHLRTGQTLTLSPIGNTIQGVLNLNGGTLIFNGGPLTLRGSLTISSPSVLDLRNWQQLQPGGTLLELISPNQADLSLLTLKLPDSLAGYRLILDPQTGCIKLSAHQSLSSQLLHSLNANQLAIYHAIMASDALLELQQSIARCTNAAELRHFLNQAGGAELAALLPSVTDGNLAHLRQLRRSAGTGHRLAPQSNTTVAMHALTHQSHARGYDRSAWGGRLQVEQHVKSSLALGLSLEAGSADTTPEECDRLTESFTYVDFYSVLHESAWQFSVSAGFGTHEFTPGRRNTEPPAATSLNFATGIARQIPLESGAILHPFLALDATHIRLSAIRESGGPETLQSGETSTLTADISLGVRYETLLPTRTRLQLRAAGTLTAGETTPALQMHFSGAPEHKFTLKPEPRDRLSGEVSAGLAHPLTPDTALHASAAARLGGNCSSFETQAGILLHF